MWQYCCHRWTIWKPFRTVTVKTIASWSSPALVTSPYTLVLIRSVPTAAITARDPVDGDQTVMMKNRKQKMMMEILFLQSEWSCDQLTRQLTISLFNIAKWLSKFTVRPSWSPRSFGPKALFNVLISMPLRLCGNGGRPGNDNLRWRCQSERESNGRKKNKKTNENWKIQYKKKLIRLAQNKSVV